MQSNFDLSDQQVLVSKLKSWRLDEFIVLILEMHLPVRSIMHTIMLLAKPTFQLFNIAGHNSSLNSLYNSAIHITESNELYTKFINDLKSKRNKA